MCVVSLSLFQGDAEAVKELLDQGADPNMKDNAGWTPLVRLKQRLTGQKLYLSRAKHYLLALSSIKQANVAALRHDDT